MKVVITGGAGFIGSVAVKHFIESGDEVINVDKLTYAANHDAMKLSTFVKLDICDTENLLKLVQQFKPDFIINFAAETHVDNSINSVKEFISSNIEGVASILDICKQTGTKLCQISTDEVYGPANNLPFSEIDPLNPMNPYAATKAAAELLIKSFHNTHKTPYVILRPSNNYGPKQYKEKFIPKLLESIKTGNKFPLYGDGLQIREWTYVHDTVQVIRKVLLAETTWRSTYNITSEISRSNREVIVSVINTYNRINNSNIEFDDVVETVEDRKGHDRKYWITSHKINNLIKHQHSKFEDVITEIVTQSNGNNNENR